MLKIATPQDLQAEIRAIMAFVHASEKPDRQLVASKLRELADRVAATLDLKTLKVGDKVKDPTGRMSKNPGVVKTVTGRFVIIQWGVVEQRLHFAKDKNHGLVKIAGVPEEPTASKLRELADRVSARKRTPKVKLPKSIDPPSYILKELQKAGLDTAVQSLSDPQSYVYKLNDKLRGNYGVSVPLPGSYQGKASIQIDPKGLTGDSGDAEVTLIAYAVANGTTTNIPLKKLKLYVWWEKRDKGYNIVLKVGTSKPNMDAEKARVQNY